MDSGVDTSVTVQELTNPTDLSAQPHHHSPTSITPAGIPVNSSGEWRSPGDSNHPDSGGPPQADPLFVPIMDDQMDWRWSAENAQNDNNQPHNPPHDPSDQARNVWSRSDSLPPLRRQENPVDPMQTDEPHAFWAEFEDDSSTPSEAELREIESAQGGDYSACECEPSVVGGGKAEY